MEELFNLRPIYENAKCYYGKAVVKIDGTKRTLYSYQDPVAEYDTATDQIKLLWDYASHYATPPGRICPSAELFI